MSQLDNPPQRRLSFIEPPNKRARFEGLSVDAPQADMTLSEIFPHIVSPESSPMSPPSNEQHNSEHAVQHRDELRVIINLDENGSLRSSIINIRDEMEAAADLMYSGPSQHTQPSQPLSQSAQPLSQPFQSSSVPHQIDEFMSDDFVPASPVLFSTPSGLIAALPYAPLDHVMEDDTHFKQPAMYVNPLDVQATVPPMSSSDVDASLVSGDIAVDEDGAIRPTPTSPPSDLTTDVLADRPSDALMQHSDDADQPMNSDDPAQLGVQSDELHVEPLEELSDLSQHEIVSPLPNMSSLMQNPLTQPLCVSTSPSRPAEFRTATGRAISLSQNSVARARETLPDIEVDRAESAAPEHSHSQPTEFRTATGRAISLSQISRDRAQALLAESEAATLAAEVQSSVSNKPLSELSDDTAKNPSTELHSTSADISLSTNIIVDDEVKVVIAIAGDSDRHDISDALSEAETEPVVEENPSSPPVETELSVEPALVQARPPQSTSPESVMQMDGMIPLYRSPTTFEQPIIEEPVELDSVADSTMNQDAVQPDSQVLDDDHQEDVAAEDPGSPTFSELDFASQSYHRMDMDEYEPASQEEAEDDQEEAHHHVEDSAFDLPDEAACSHQATRTMSHTSTCSSRSTDGGNHSDDERAQSIAASERIHEQLRMRISQLENELSTRSLALHRTEIQLRGAAETKEIMQAENNQLLTQHSQMASQLARAQVQVQRSEEKLMHQALDHQRFKTAMSDENQRLKAELDDLRNQARSLRDQCKSLEETRASLTSDRDHWASQYQAERQRAAFELTQQVQQFNAAMEQKQAEINAISSSPLHTKMEELNQQITVLTSERAEAIREKEEAEARAKLIRRELKDLKKQTEKDKEQWNSEYGTTQRALQDLALKSVEQKSTLAHLEKDRTELLAKVKTLEEERAAFAKQDKELLRLQLTEAMHQSQLTRLDSERQDLVANLRAIASEKDNLNNKFHDYKEQVKKEERLLTDRINELTHQTAELREKTSGLKEKVDSLTVREAKAQEMVARLQSAGRALEEEKRGWVAEKFRFDSERADKEERIIELKEQVKTLREQRVFMSRQAARSPPIPPFAPQQYPTYYHADQQYSDSMHLVPADPRIVSYEQPSPSNSISNVPTVAINSLSSSMHSKASSVDLSSDASVDNSLTLGSKPQVMDVDTHSTVSEPVITRMPRDVSVRASKRADSADETASVSSSRSSSSNKAVNGPSEPHVTSDLSSTLTSHTKDSTVSQNKISTSARVEPERIPAAIILEKQSVVEPLTPKLSVSTHSKASTKTTHALAEEVVPGEPVSIEHQPAKSPVILITGFGDQREEVIRIIEKLGGRHEDDGPSEETTHCLMAHFQATIKSLTCSIKGLWMVERSWLDASEKADKFVDPNEHKALRYDANMFQSQTYTIDPECEKSANSKPGMIQLVRSVITAGGGRVVLCDLMKGQNVADHVIIANRTNKKWGDRGITCDQFLGQVPFYKAVQAAKKIRPGPVQPPVALPVVTPVSENINAPVDQPPAQNVTAPTDVEPKTAEARTRVPNSASKHLSQDSGSASENSRRSSRKREKPQPIELSDEAAFELALQQSREEASMRKQPDGLMNDVDVEPESRRKKQKINELTKATVDMEADEQPGSSIKSRRRTAQVITTPTTKSKLKSKK